MESIHRHVTGRVYAATMSGLQLQAEAKGNVQALKDLPFAKHTAELATLPSYNQLTCKPAVDKKTLKEISFTEVPVGTYHGPTPAL